MDKKRAVARQPHFLQTTNYRLNYVIAIDDPVVCFQIQIPSAVTAGLALHQGKAGAAALAPHHRSAAYCLGLAAGILDHPDFQFFPPLFDFAILQLEKAKLGADIRPLQLFVLAVGFHRNLLDINVHNVLVFSISEDRSFSEKALSSFGKSA